MIQKETIRSFIHPFLPTAKPQKAFYGWHWWTSSFSDETGNNTETDYYYALGFAVNILWSFRRLTWSSLLRLIDSKRNSHLSIFFRQYVIPCCFSRKPASKRTCLCNQASPFLQYNAISKPISSYVYVQPPYLAQVNDKLLLSGGGWCNNYTLFP